MTFRDILDLQFGGTFQTDTTYTSAGAEVLVGEVRAHGGVSSSPGRGVRLSSGARVDFMTNRNDGAAFVLELLANGTGCVAELDVLRVELVPGHCIVRIGGESVFEVPCSEGAPLAFAYDGVELQVFCDGFGVAPLDCELRLGASVGAATLRLGGDFDGDLQRVRLAVAEPAHTVPVAIAPSDITFAPVTRAQVMFDEVLGLDEGQFEGPDEFVEFECDDLSSSVIVEAIVEVRPTRAAYFNLINIGGAAALEFRDGELHLSLLAGDEGDSATPPAAEPLTPAATSAQSVAWTADSIPPYHPGYEYAVALHLSRTPEVTSLELFVGGMRCGSVSHATPPATHPNPQSLADDSSRIISFGGDAQVPSTVPHFGAAFTRVRAVAYEYSPRSDFFALQQIFEEQTLLNQRVTGPHDFTPDLPVRGLNAPLLAEAALDPAVFETPETELLSLGDGVTLLTAPNHHLELRLTTPTGPQSQLFSVPELPEQTPFTLSLHTIVTQVMTVRVSVNGAELALVQTSHPILHASGVVHFGRGAGEALHAVGLQIDGNASCGVLHEFGDDSHAPANHFAVTRDDSPQSILAKAAALRPTPAQYEWQLSETAAFLHFGINTMYDQEWGHGNEDPQRFNPTALDTDQWARELVAAGFTSAIVVVKHHDGFMLNQTRYNREFGVAASPWCDGHGDVLRDFAASAAAVGIRVGVYLSTADSYQETQGIFGNGSAKQQVTIPELVPGDDRAANQNLPQFTYELDDYNRYLFNTMYEILTEYGPIHEVWFDGAQGNTQTPQPYDFANLYAMIAALQPQAFTAISGEAVRWVGNEDGFARFNEWSPTATRRTPNGNEGVVGEMAAEIGSSAALIAAVRNDSATGLRWFPAESDARLTSGWFWGPSKSEPKSARELTEMWFRSVGHNSVLLLNIPPDNSGKISDACVASLVAWRAELRREMPQDLLKEHPVFADGTAAPTLTDGSSRTGIALASATATLRWEFATPIAADKLSLSEKIDVGGQQIENFRILADGALVDVRVPGVLDSDPGAVVTDCGTVGARKIVRFAQPVTARVWQVEIVAARSAPVLAQVQLFCAK